MPTELWSRAAMGTGPARAMLSVAVFVGWILVTVLLGGFWSDVEGTQPLDVAISNSIAPSFLVAIAFLIAAIVAFRWYDIGLNPPRPIASLRLLWFPALYILGFTLLLLVAGLPPAPVVGVILANTVMVGISEELACRGVLYQGLRSRFRVWTAILASTLLFGAVHLFNGLTTGDFLAAGLQAVAAFMTGITFMAIRLRTRSIFPGIVLHALWNFTLVTAAVSLMAMLTESGADGARPSAGELGLLAATPLLLVLPNFLYGLYLLRHVARDETAATGAAAPAP